MSTMIEPLILTGASNFRDIGGWRAPGGVVENGLIYRSNQLARLTTEDLHQLDSLGIAAVVDLRSERERLAQPTARQIASQPHYVSPKADTDFVFNEIFATTERDAASWSQAFARFYAEMPERYADEFGVFLRLIANGDLPMVVHCSAGKDRTGAACAIVLDVLGVHREDIVMDYLMSSTRLNDDTHFTNMLSDAKLTQYEGLPPDCRAVMLGTDRAYILGMLEAIDLRYGSVIAYLEDRLKIDSAMIARIGDRLLRPDTD